MLQFISKVALAVLIRHREVLLDSNLEFDEMCKYVNELNSETINPEQAVFDAEFIFHELVT